MQSRRLRRRRLQMRKGASDGLSSPEEWEPEVCSLLPLA